MAKACHSRRRRVEIRTAVPGIAEPRGEVELKSRRAA